MDRGDSLEVLYGSRGYLTMQCSMPMVSLGTGPIRSGTERGSMKLDDLLNAFISHWREFPPRPSDEINHFTIMNKVSLVSGGMSFIHLLQNATTST